ncbi:hypothetical protein [Amycolatopsis antarctica]|nr:hypothetical protein [Amycolatopsis antarctica]
MAIGAVVSISACGQQSAMSPAAQPPPAGGPGITADEAVRQDETTRWASGYCTTVGGLVQTLTTMPAVDPSSPESAARTSSELLAVMIGGLDRTIDGLGELGPAPGQEGDLARQNVSADLTRIRERAVATKADVDETPPSSEDGREAIGAVKLPLDALAGLRLLKGFDATPALDTATRRAPSCADLAKRDPAAEPPPR